MEVEFISVEVESHQLWVDAAFASSIKCCGDDDICLYATNQMLASHWFLRQKKRVFVEF